MVTLAILGALFAVLLATWVAHLEWVPGRQGGGYQKMMLVKSERFHFDCYLLWFPEGSHIPVHTDPSPDGFEHHRINIDLKTPPNGGITLVDGPCSQGEGFLYFRPDLYPHWMTTCIGGSMLIFSIGWLKRV